MSPHTMNDDSVARVLSVLPLGTGTHGDTVKLGSVKVGDPESVYMVATFCFDLFRRLQYVAKVALPFGDHMPPEIAREILKDDADINAGKNWRERAETAEQVTRRLHRELAGEWERRLERAAQGTPV